jgi:hypothetical protein
MKGSPPLRFLAVVLGGWAAARTALIAPLWPTPPAHADAAAAAPQGRVRPMASGKREAGRARRGPATALAGGDPRAAIPVSSHAEQRPPRPIPVAFSPAPPGRKVARAPAVAAAVPSPPPPHLALPPRPDPGSARPGRWSLSAWSFVRRGGAEPLAAGGLLGGSQAGARLLYRLDRGSERPLALSVRLAAPLRRPAGAEAALGLDWQPSARLPVHLLVERRQALGRDGRSAFQLTAYGGAGDVPLGRFRLDAYAQAGIVGARSRDPFGDGSIRLSLPLARNLRAGVGAWAAAQPGLARVDVGPQAALRLPVTGRAVTLAADWRLRLAGNARPGSGPALTLATDF